MLITVLMCNFSKYCWPFRNFWDKFHPKTCFSPYLMKFSIEMRRTYISQNKLEASKECENMLLNKRVFVILVLYMKPVSKFCVYVYVYVFVFGATYKLPLLCTINSSIQFSENSMCFIKTRLQ